jgi:DDE family transposase
MTPAKCSDLDYIHFLMSAHCSYSCCSASRCVKYGPNSPHHDSFTRLLHRQPQDTGTLWKDVSPLISLKKGYLIVDDSTLEKPHSRSIELVSLHWSGNQHRIVPGISLVTLVWTDGDVTYPVDFRIYSKERDGKTKNDHFADMLKMAKERGFSPEFVLFDSWYSSMRNLMLVKKLGWHFLTRLKKNRMVKTEETSYCQIHEFPIPGGGINVRLKGVGIVRVFHRDNDGNGIQFWATDFLEMSEEERNEISSIAFKIEQYHRNLKQYCGVESCQARKANAQMGHILLSIRAVVRMEWIRIKQNISLHEQKEQPIREAMRHRMNNLQQMGFD